MDRWLAWYGIELRPDVVLQPDACWEHTRTDERGNPVLRSDRSFESVRYPALPEVRTDDLALLNGLASVWRSSAGKRWPPMTLPYPSSLVVHAERQPAATYQVILESSLAYAVATSGLSARDTKLPDGERGVRVLGVAIEGELRRADRSARARIAVVASDILANPFSAVPLETRSVASQGYPRRFLLDVLRELIFWARGDERLNACKR